MVIRAYESTQPVTRPFVDRCNHAYAECHAFQDTSRGYELTVAHAPLPPLSAGLQDAASQWVAFRFSCSGSAQRLEELIDKYKKIYSLSTDASAQPQATAGRLLRAAQGTA